MKVIIGKNSRIIKSIEPVLQGKDYRIISHQDVYDINWRDVESIYLFSWDHKSWYGNENLLNAIPRSKVIFISTVAVYSLLVRKQWNKYPNQKYLAEKIILESGGKVVRFGIVGEESLEKLTGCIPFTSSEMIMSLLLMTPSRLGKVTNLYTLRNGLQRHSLIQHASYNFANIIGYLFPSSVFFRAPLELLLKLLGVNRYGYTKDMLSLFGNESLIGFGVLGSTYCKVSTKPDVVFVSGKDDVMLNGDGFIGTRIGKKNSGLAKFWHGVEIVRKHGSYKKVVPLFVKRPHVPIASHRIEVDKLSIEDNKLKLSLSSEIEQAEVFCNRAVLAAGAVGNVMILRDYFDTCVLSDHEIGSVGKISSLSPTLKNYFKFYGPLMVGRRVHRIDEPGTEAIIDFRPETNRNHVENPIYNDSTFNILKKLIQRASLSQINEAIFNKFGIGFRTRYLNVFVQIVSKDCVNIDKNCKMTRQRLDQIQLNRLLQLIGFDFPDFQAAKDIKLVDGIHAHGAASLLSNSDISHAISSNRLQILGSPHWLELDACHHTKKLIREIQESSHE